MSAPGRFRGAKPDVNIVLKVNGLTCVDIHSSLAALIAMFEDAGEARYRFGKVESLELILTPADSLPEYPE